MVFDIPNERGGASLPRRWGEGLCHFPLLGCLQPLSMPNMALVYAALWLGAMGVMLGFQYRVSSVTFAATYWYLFLVEKSYWNNHSYLFGLVAVLLACSNAGSYWSIDAYLEPAKKNNAIPYWNYFVLKYQFFILYFMAGLKKGTAEWLTGYSVPNLSEHWVFAPFRLFLTVQQTDYLVVHWFIFLFDLTVAVWMMWARTRHVAMLFCALFHLMNSRLFSIGMFPWVCLATMPLFYPFDWPKRAMQYLINSILFLINNDSVERILNFLADIFGSGTDETEESEATDDLTTDDIDNIQDYNTDNQIESDKIFDENKRFETEINNEELVEDFLQKENTEYCNVKYKSVTENYGSDNSKRLTIYLILFYVVIQAFLPFSHFITKGYNNWTDGLYGYSWDMMVHTWDTHSVIVKAVDNEKNFKIYVDPFSFTPNDRWTKHGDMVYQYAHCLANRFQKYKVKTQKRFSTNISIYIDVWCSLNGRFTQRMFDPKVDLLTANWSPFQPIPYLMPILDEGLSWRTKLDEIRKHVTSWSNPNDVAFFADFPGYAQEKFIPTELRNVTLTVLKGSVAFEAEITELFDGQSTILDIGQHTSISPGTSHNIINIGNSSAFYMYTFYNSTKTPIELRTESIPKLPIGSEIMRRINNMLIFGKLIINSIDQIISDLF